MADEMYVHIATTEVRPEAQEPVCRDHPTATSTSGFGLAGGGMGGYQMCDICGRLFGKVVMDEEYE